ncbi:MAG: RluA family pseudouridine synthase [Nitrospiraceae bacterium]|nr:RluA family pseudouridine synthase [Nitrospiraceae bacterium]
MTEETMFSYRISTQFADRSLIDFLAGRFKYRPPAEWLQMIGFGRVTVNGAMTAADHLLKKDDIVSYRDVLREPPVDRNIQILHEEETFLVANKPGNLPSHSVGRYIRNTFIFLLRQRMADRGFQGTIHLAHRLDRETSGIIVAAKTSVAHRSLLRQFETGTVKKEYVAVARGIIHEDSFGVRGFLAPDRDSCISIRKKVVYEDSAGAKSSETAFDVIKRKASSTVVRCRPITGRTNQIRVHLEHAGHPVVGDKLYGRSDDEFLAFARNVRAGDYGPLPWLETPRHLLHASRLIIHHPISGEVLVFDAPLPGDMRSFIRDNRF